MRARELPSADDLDRLFTDPARPSAEAALIAAAEQRILIIDGAMGTEIQALNLKEPDFRNDRFKDCACSLERNYDILAMTQPQAIEDIHYAYAMAGADILETNTFSATSIVQADYELQSIAYELNRDAARVARRAALRAEREDGKRRFVAGAIGPTNRTASISPDVNNPGFRAVSFDDLRLSYGEQIRALLDADVDLILIETIFDTLNAKAAIFACNEAFEARGQRKPLMISGTITDNSGRTLTGQTPTAFWHSVRHAKPFSIGLNCALGADKLREHLAEIAQHADTRTSAYPNAGLPNGFGGYDESPEFMARAARGLRERGPHQHRRRLLRHDARAHQGDRRDDAPLSAARHPQAHAAASPVRPGALHPDAGHSVREHRRAHQRHRQREIPQADHGGRLCRRARGGARPGGQRRAGDRRQHGRRPDRLRQRR